jgi:hypothetical protein
MFSRSVSRFVVRRLFAVLLLLTPAVVLRADAAAQTQRPDVRLPQSPQDHAELAGLYQKLAAQQRGRAESFRKSLAAQIQRIAVAPNKTGVESPWVAKLKREAHPEISEAETAAAEAERSAEYHRMRAKELAGLEFATLASASAGGRR